MFNFQHFVILLSVCLCSFLSKAQVNSGNTRKLFLPLQSMQGTWSMTTPKGRIYENWMRVNDSTLKSRSYSLHGKDTILFEEVELVERENSIAYIPRVKDQNNGKAVSFLLVKCENGEYVFENKLHDFPQRIIYRLPENNRMHAWIEGTLHDRDRKEDFQYEKID